MTSAEGENRLVPNDNHNQKDEPMPDNTSEATIVACAKVAHEVNRAYCIGLGDDSQAPWDEAPQWQRNSAVLGAEFTLDNPDAGDSASHDSWLAEKARDGWVHGEVKDPEAKTHPCIVPFDELPLEQQTKDALFRATVLGVAASRKRSAD